MGIEKPAEWLGREVMKSGKNIISGPQWRPEQGIAGNMMDMLTGTTGRAAYELLRVPTKGIWDIMTWSLGKMGNVLGDTVRLTGKALAAIPSIPFTRR